MEDRLLVGQSNIGAPTTRGGRFTKADGRA
jgi:hypothetical protein